MAVGKVCCGQEESLQMKRALSSLGSYYRGGLSSLLLLDIVSFESCHNSVI